MANTFIAINRGADPSKLSSYTIGAASSAATDFELRVASLDGNGKPTTRYDAVKALKAIKRILENQAIFGLGTGFPPPF